MKKQVSLQTIVDSFAHDEIRTVDELIERFGGSGYDSLLYVFTAQDAQKYLEEVATGFPEQSANVALLGYDWLGRILGINKVSDQVYLFVPGTGDVLEIVKGLKLLFTQEVGQYPEEIFSSNFYDSWKDMKGALPKYGFCIGYKVPLFLNGKDDPANLELTDLSVYWYVTVQLIVKARGMKEGEKIDSLHIS